MTHDFYMVLKIRPIGEKGKYWDTGRELMSSEKSRIALSVEINRRGLSGLTGNAARRARAFGQAIGFCSRELASV